MDSEEQRFYEEKFIETHPWRWYHRFFLPLHLGLYKIYWFQKRIKKGARVLDLGCGGGREFFANNYQMTGVDISEHAIKNAKRIYQNAIVADVRAIPFPDKTFDYVISMDVLGHIPLADKAGVISEIFRVLKPGGGTIHYIETKRKNNELEKRYPGLYYENFVLKDGHFGLETPTETVERFRQFKILKVQGHAALLSPIEDYAKRFDNEMKDINPWIKFLTWFSKIVGEHTYLRFIVNCTFGIPARILNSTARLDNSSGVFIAAQKPVQ